MSVTNELAAPLRVHGLCSRDGSPCPPLDVPPGAIREVRFAAGRAGTYHYWATTLGAPVPFRELGGAFIVDPPGADRDADRVLVITEWTSLTADDAPPDFSADDIGEAFIARQPSVAFMLNGLGWPATERLTYRLGEPVRWRVLNLSSQPHPMHLHGFYFDVERLGDGRRDAPPAAAQPRRVVTQLLPPGGDAHHDLDARASRELAVPLPLDGARVAAAPAAGRAPQRRSPRAAPATTPTRRSACRDWFSA